MRAKAILTLLFASVFVCGAAEAGTLNQHVKAGLHIELHESRSCTKNMPVIEDRQDFVNYWLQVDYPCDFDVFLVLFSFDEIGGVEFALDWPCQWGSTWYTFHCADYSLGKIDNPGDWTALVWEECQPGLGGQAYLVAVWAWLTATGPGELTILPCVTGQVGVVPCPGTGYETSIVESVFCAGIGIIPYMGPPQVATEPTTWGSIKAMFQ
jgi:hypothetical protein